MKLYKRPSEIFIYIILFILALPVLWSMWSMVVGSLMPIDELEVTIAPALKDGDTMAIMPLLPSYPTLQPLLELLMDTPEFFVMFWNSWKIVIPAVLGQLMVGTTAAWALSRLRFRGRKVLLVLYITLMLMPFQVTMVPNYLMIDSLGIMDTLWAVALPIAFSAFPVFIMTKSFDSVHMSVIEAAKVDGAGYLRTFFYIGIPLGMPGILSALVLGFLETWNAIEQPMLFMREPSTWPLSIFLPQISVENLGLSMIASLIVLMPAGLIFLFGQKYLVLGIQSAGVKE